MGRDAEMRSTSPRIPGRRTRISRIKRKRPDVGDAVAAAPAATPVSKLAKQVWKGRGRGSPKHYGQRHHSTDSCAVVWKSGKEENQIQDGKASSMMPDKRILQLVLDTLQRRDTYEIFAEPVNPEEVEDYYEIIKDPMDFGTMRAKLHEGMYGTLEEFQRDVFLIPENAMRFNSSGTTYFRQARAIHELAKKVFDALKMDPENFVLEYSGTRRRSMRKALSESKDSRSPVGINSANIASDAFPKGTPTFRRISKSSKKTPAACTTTGTSTTPPHAFRSRNWSRDSRALSSSPGADRRFTYTSRGEWRSPLFTDNHTAVDSTSSHTACNQLLLMINNQVDLSYRNSLISFVKDLGPTAQMVARQKLLNLREHESTTGCLEATGHRPTRHLYPGPRRRPLHLLNIIDLTEDGAEANGNYRSAEKQKIDNTALRTDEKSSGNHRSNKIKRPGLRNYGKSDDNNVKPVILALESSHSKGDFKLRNKKSSTTSLSSFPWSQRYGLREDSNSMKPPPPPPPAPLPAGPSSVPSTSSQFTFDLPFLKARLDQMNSANAVKRGGERLMKGPSSAAGGGGRGVERAALNSKQQSL